MKNSEDSSEKCSNKYQDSCRKSPNILIYSENEADKEKLESTLRKVLDCDRYTIYKVSKETLENKAWKGKVTLVVVVGNIGQSAPVFSEYFLEGGRILAMQSDVLYTILQYIKSTEIREEIFELTGVHSVLSKEQFMDKCKVNYECDIRELMSNDDNPVVLKVTDLTNNGLAIFCQMHLDKDKSNVESLAKVLTDLLDLHVNNQDSVIEYTKGYFLGDHEQKISHIKTWCSNSRRTQNLNNLTIQWCFKEETPMESPSKSFLPIFVDDLPDKFSTEDYFNNLTSNHLGRLIVYTEVISSTMNVTNHTFVHGLGAIARRQLTGRGRGGNAWISPPGQATMSLQVWQKISPSLPLIQHAAALAIIRAIRWQSYEHLEVRIKWPNDIYYGRNVKIGGVVTTANCMSDDVVVDIGTGVNISNSVPTVCVNDIIKDYNKENETGLPLISVESFLARYCSELETILDSLNENIETFLQQYYKYWLHSDEEIRLKTKDECPVQGTIVGVDSAGWLLVRTASGEVTVAPDGNTFDIMSGLVAPKW